MKGNLAISPLPATKTDNRRSDRFRRFADLKIRTKIALGFAVMLVVLGVTALTCYLSFGEVARSFTEVVLLTADVDSIGAVERDFVDLRRANRVFQVEGTEAAAKAALEIAPRVMATIDGALATIAAPERHKRLEQIKAYTLAFNEEFGRMLAARRDQNTLIRDTIDVSGHQMRIDFEAMNTAAAKAPARNAAALLTDGLQNLMQVCLNVNYLLLHSDDAAAKEVEKYLALLQTSLAKLDEVTRDTAMRPPYDEVKELLAKYVLAYKHVLLGATEISNVAKEMKGTADATLKETTYLRVSSRDEQRAVGEAMRGLLQRAGAIVVSIESAAPSSESFSRISSAAASAGRSA
jgi:CHASE3 domain sensor protein